MRASALPSAICLLALLSACDEPEPVGCRMDLATVRRDYGNGRRAFTYDEMRRDLEGRCEQGRASAAQCADQPRRMLSHNTGYVGFHAIYDSRGRIIHVSGFSDDDDERCHGIVFWPGPEPEGGSCAMTEGEDLCPDGAGF